MKLLILMIPLLLMAVPAFAEEPDEVFSFWTILSDKKMKTTVETWYIQINIKDSEPIIIKQGKGETTEEFIERAEKMIEIISLIQPIAEPSEEEVRQAEIMKIVEAARKELTDEDKRLDKLKEFCSYGQDGFKVTQQVIEFESLKALIQRYGETDVKELRLNQAFETCRAMQNYKVDLKQWEHYPGVDEVTEMYKSTRTVYDALGRADSEIWNQRHLDEHDFIQALEDAEETQCSTEGKQRGLCVREFTGLNRGSQPEGKLCQFNPTTQAIDLCPIKALAEYDAQKIKTYDTATTVLCDMAYKETWKGTTSKTWWPNILVDGTCDKFIPELVETRGDYVREQWKGQTEENCPDCTRFK